MGTFTNIARQGKDKALSKALEALGQRYAGKFGKIMELKLDSANREIHLTILLKGESEPVIIHVKGYEIIAEDAPYTFLYFPYAKIAISNSFKGIEPAPAGISSNFIDWYVEPGDFRY